MRDLVARSGVSLGVVNRLEGGGCATHTSTAARIVTAFAANGVRLVGDDSYTGAVLMRSGK